MRDQRGGVYVCGMMCVSLCEEGGMAGMCVCDARVCKWRRVKKTFERKKSKRQIDGDIEEVQ